MRRPVLALLALMALPAVAPAHGLDISYKLAPGGLTVTLTYDDDEPCADAVVKVLNAAGEVVAEGKSDAKGVCGLPAPPPGDYLIRAKTEDGHASKQPLHVPPDPAATPETVSSRPPRMLYLGLGLAGIAAATGLVYWYVRRRQAAPPVA